MKMFVKTIRLNKKTLDQENYSVLIIQQDRNSDKYSNSTDA